MAAKRKPPEKRFVSERIGYSLDLEGDLDAAIKLLQDAKAEHGTKYARLKLEEDWYCGCRGNCDCGKKPFLYGERLETDAEFEARLEKERVQEAEQLERDRAALATLKAKLGEK